MFKIIRSLLIALLAIICVTCGYTQMESKNTVCDQKYALCTSAPCIPDPNDSSKAVCYCTVHEGKSFGQVPCRKRMPHSKDGLVFLTSTYSFDDASTKQMMTCPSGKPWTSCLDKPCTVNPRNPSEAICQCDLLYDQEFITWGGECDQSTCDSSYWSGATLNANNEAISFLSKILKIEPPQNYCP